MTSASGEALKAKKLDILTTTSNKLETRQLFFGLFDKGQANKSKD